MTYALSFTTTEEATNFFSLMGLCLVRKLPAAYAGTIFGDSGERISMVAMKSGLNAFEVTERVI